MRAVLRAAAAGPVVLLAAALISGCGSTDITSKSLDAAVGPVFARLYELHQQDLGTTGSDRRPDGVAQCVRGPISSNVSAATATVPGPSFSGAGDDWSCVVNFPYPDGHIEPIVYDLAVQATGCFVASGPSSIVGPQTFAAADGRTVTNPLFEFDGCLDLH